MGDEAMKTKACRHCRERIDRASTRCKFCAGDLRSWPRRHVILTLLAGAAGLSFVGLMIDGALGMKDLEKTLADGPHRVQGTEWWLKTGKSAMTDRPLASASLTSHDEVKGKNPELFVRCEDGVLNIFIDTGWSVSMESDERHAVRYRFDQAAPVKARLEASTDGKYLFFERPASMLKSFQAGKSLMLEYSSLTFGAQTVTFPIAGYAGVAAAIDACIKH